jgi:glyoxylase-like metal-dependent hydrolase (beta-lactamase superfamily II)
VDWDMVAKLPPTEPGGKFGPPPARDMDITDGQKLTLGNTTLTFYITPGHTPGTVSMLVPVTDHGQTTFAFVLGRQCYSEGAWSQRTGGPHGFGYSRV